MRREEYGLALKKYGFGRKQTEDALAETSCENFRVRAGKFGLEDTRSYAGEADETECLRPEIQGRRGVTVVGDSLKRETELNFSRA